MVTGGMLTPPANGCRLPTCARRRGEHGGVARIFGMLTLAVRSDARNFAPGGECEHGTRAGGWGNGLIGGA